MLDIDGIVRGSLARISQQSEASYQCVKVRVQSFIDANRGLWKTAFLHSFLDDLDRQHWMAKAKRRTVEEVISFLNQIPDTGDQLRIT